jgi:hypothetical protein
MKGMLLNITRKRKCSQISSEEVPTGNVSRKDGEEEKQSEADMAEGTIDQKRNKEQPQFQASLSPIDMLFNQSSIPSKVRKKGQDGRLVESARGDFAMPSHAKYLAEGFLLGRQEIEELFSVPMEHEISKETMTAFAKTLHFAEHCVELCWLMQAGQPPMFLDADIPENGRFETDILKQYTKKGNSIDYMVWPVLYLYKNGPMLSKGVAQPK